MLTGQTLTGLESWPDDTVLPFEFLIEGPPVSQQTRRRQDRLLHWRATVRAAAEARWPDGTPPVDQEISVEITHFFEGVPADVDNIVKPILDASKGLVYRDDRQITDLVSRRRPLEGPYTADPVSAVLAEGISLGREFLHIRVTPAPTGGELRFL
jgi:crossover junction endodeoxyribonuclease RusA